MAERFQITGWLWFTFRLSDYSSINQGCFILAAMTLYEMPAESPYQRPFRIFAVVAIILLLGIFCIATWTPVGLSDETRKVIGWVAGVIVVAAVVIGTRLGVKEALWKVKQGYRVEVADGKIIQRRLGSPIVEVPLDHITSLHESRGGWLFIRGGDPARQVTVPLEVIGFENLKQEISANQVVSQLRIKLSPSLFLPSALLVLACFFLFTSHSRMVVMTAGGTALLLQGFATYSLRRLWRANPKASLLMLAYILTFVVLAWIVYERSISHF
jgi:hypothetical protein